MPDSAASYTAEPKSNGATSSPESRPVVTETVAGFSLRDTPSAIDNLGFKPYVEAVTAFLTHESTIPPLTVSIEGEWGSGKSSFMLMLEETIQKHYSQRNCKAKIVRFNAWRYDKDEALWAAFALAVTRSLASTLSWSRRFKANLSLQIERFDWSKGWFSIARFVVLILFFGYTTTVLGNYLIHNSATIKIFGDSASTSIGEKKLQLSLGEESGAGQDQPITSGAPLMQSHRMSGHSCGSTNHLLPEPIESNHTLRLRTTPEHRTTPLHHLQLCGWPRSNP
jgi:hypothetical protein